MYAADGKFYDLYIYMLSYQNKICGEYHQDDDLNIFLQEKVDDRMNAFMMTNYLLVHA